MEINLSARGFATPVSHLATVERSTFSAAAVASWASLAFILIFANPFISSPLAILNVIHIIANYFHIVKLYSEIYSHCLIFVDIVKHFHYNVNEVIDMFGERLKALRKKYRITQEELAAIIGVERSSIGKYEGKSHTIPSDDIKYKIAEYFHVSIDYLMGKTDQEYTLSQNDLSSEEIKLISLFRRLNVKGQSRVIQCAQDCSDNPTMQESQVNLSAM